MIHQLAVSTVFICLTLGPMLTLIIVLFKYIVSCPFLILDVINKARAFVTLSHFHPNLTFTSKGEENPIGAVKVGSYPCPQILD